MYRYIGIRGHRGSGKSSISILLALALDSLVKNKGTFSENFDSLYDSTVAEIKLGKKLSEFFVDNCQIDTFAEEMFTQIKMIFGIPIDYCYDDDKKDSIIVNLRTFEYEEDSEYFQKNELVSAKAYFEQRNAEIDCEENPRKIRINTYMTLRELIVYYGLIMKSFFGANVWLKSMQQSSKEFEEFYANDFDVFKIYSDVKFTSEVDYIKDKQGIIINTVRSKMAKPNFETSTNLTYDTRIDFEIDYTEICESETREIIKDLAKKVLNYCIDENK